MDMATLIKLIEFNLGRKYTVEEISYNTHKELLTKINKKIESVTIEELTKLLKEKNII